MELFPAGRNPVTITLYKNIPFDNTYKHHILNDYVYLEHTDDVIREGRVLSMNEFLSMSETFEDGRYTGIHFPSLTLTGSYNFDYGNGLICSVVLEVPSNFTSANYMKVETYNGASNEYRYYFITRTTLSCSSDTSSTVRMELELDVFATYGYDLMQNLRDKPLFTERKHCQRFKTLSGGRYVYNGNELLVNEPDISATPTILERVSSFKPTTYSNSSIFATPVKQALEKIVWLYVSLSKLSRVGVSTSPTTINNIPTQTYIVAIPLIKEFNILIENKREELYQEHNIKPIEWLKDAFADADVVSIKASPFPPYDYINGDINCTFNQNGSDNPLDWSLSFGVGISNYLAVETTTAGNNAHLVWFGNTTRENAKSVLIFDGRYMPVIQKFDNLRYEYVTTGDNNIGFTTIKSEFGIGKVRDAKYEPKLQVAPFKKYSLFYRSDEGYELHPETCMTQAVLTGTFSLYSYATPEMNDNVVSTYIHYITQDYSQTNSDYYTELNIGLNTNFRYQYPSGTNALSNFYQTQSASFSADVISKVLAGALSVGVGIAMLSNPVTTAAGIAGMAGVVSGTLGAGSALLKAGTKSIDLKNTPNKMGATATNLFHDYGILYTEGLSYFPLYVVEGLSKTEEKIALDYFYNYGYNVQRECRFSYDLSFDNDRVDERLITRRLFNYVKINDNIRKHINKGEFSIPTIVVEKINNILNNGITLWTMINIPVAWNIYNRYLFQDAYENAEID